MRGLGLSPGQALSGPSFRMSGDWERALADYRAAEGAVEEAGRVCSALRPGPGGASQAEVHVAEELFGDRLETLYALLRRLLVVPAPDVGAFLLKVELMIEHEVGTLSGGEACMEAVREEARGLRGV